MRARAALFAVALLASAAGADELVPLGRLPDDVTPTRYALALDLRPGQPRFTGEVRITVELKRPRDVLWLHGKGLTVHDATVEHRGTVQPATWRAEPEGGVASLRVTQPIGPGTATLTLRFDAHPGATDHRGLVAVDVEGRHYVFSQFEPTAARRAFPCFDEPGFKTPFEITLTVRRADVALSNSPVAEEIAEATQTRVRFAPTPPLPTYLVAIAAGPFDVMETGAIPANVLRPRPIPLRGFTVRGRGEEIRAALDITRRLVEKLERYVDRAFPYEKLDLLAFPEHPNAAMEHPGLITLRPEHALV